MKVTNLDTRLIQTKVSIRRDRDRRHLSPREARRLERQRDNRRMDRRDRRGDRYEYYR